jgi:hypothetical protein
MSKRYGRISQKVKRWRTTRYLQGAKSKKLRAKW